MIDEEILKATEKLINTQKQIQQQIMDQGFSHKDRDYSIGYIQGVEDVLNILHNLNRDKFPRF
jgi:hypothetical protein